MAFTKEEQYQTALIILRTAERLKTGKDKLAAFLKGSRSKIIKEPSLDLREGYGALLWHELVVIKDFTQQLIEMEFLSPYFVRTGDYSYPILVLTPVGKKALAEKIDIPLMLRDAPPIANESERETLSLFNQGNTVKEIAEKRELALSTIYTHLVNLVASGELHANQFISQNKVDTILQVISKLPNLQLKKIKERLPDVSYDEIRSVMADKILVKL